MKDTIPQFLQENLSNKNANPRFFKEDLKQFILDYGIFYNYPNTKELQDNKLVSLWFRYMKSNISNIGICEYKDCTKQKKIVNNSKTNGFKISLGCCSGHSGKIINLKLYGVENVMQLESIKEKYKDTILEKYGVENVMQLESTRDKMVSNNLEKYGVENVMHVASIMEKSQQNSFLEKEYLWKTGEISIVQGYEPIVLRELEDKGYLYQDIKTDIDDMPEIYYFFEDRNRRYYPDFYIPSENLIIEVKSDYVLQKELKQNQAKFKATKALGFDFRLEVR